jgi:hypothetical protein
MKKLNESLTWHPWVGSKYGKSDYGSLLLCGESHYESSEYDKNATINEIQRYLEPGATGRFWTMVGKHFNPEDSKSIWENVAFANLVQRPMDDTKERPSEDDFKTIAPAFEALLELKPSPSRVIIFSRLAWDNLPLEDKKMEPLKVDGHEGLRCEYSLNYGVCNVLCIPHPGFNGYKYRPIVQKFLKLTTYKEISL